MHETSTRESPTGETVRVVDVEPLLVSIAATQKILGGISERSVYRLLDGGDLESIPVGHGQGRRMIPLESLRAYVERQRAKVPAS